MDYDQIAFLSASVLEERKINAIHKASGNTKEFKTRTEFWGRKKNSLEGSWLGDQNIMREAEGKKPFSREDFEIEDVQVAPEVSHVLYAAKTKINTICDHLGINNYFGVVGKGETFRHEFSLPQKYKYNRSDVLRPIRLTDAKDYLIEKHAGEVVTGIEADDRLTQYGYQGWLDYKKTGKFSYIPVTMDKDQRGSPCLYFDLFRAKDSFKHPSPILIDNGLGEIWMEKGEVKGYGSKWMAVQMLKGDSSDNVRPYQDFDLKYGDATCYADIAEAVDQKDLFTRVLNRYSEWFPEGVSYTSWDKKEINISSQEWAGLMFKLVYMQRLTNDQTTFDKVLKHYGVI